MPELEHIRCQRQQVLLDADSSLDHVFFPDSGVVSVVAVYADGSIIEMATIGREGCAGVQAVFGAKSSSARLLVQIPGSAAKMSRAAFTRAMGSMPSFRSLMYAYVQAFLEQVMVSVACNGAHSLKERLARWLLMMRDRSDEEALQITQNLLAEMLGVQRPTVTNAAGELERAGLIERGRQQVTILDRQGLIEASCECYKLVRARVASHLPKTYINTGTTIVTFLMVFLIQNSQNRDSAAIQVKLDELIRVSTAHNSFVGIEHLNDNELQEIRTKCERRAEAEKAGEASVKRTGKKAKRAADSAVG